MKQHYPLDPVTGIENPALAWANGNPATGTNGSYPPFGLFLDPQKEILAAQRAGGLTDSADGSDTAQLAQAISRGTWLGVLAQPATLNDLVAALPGSVIWPGLLIGMEFGGVISASNTGPMTVTLTGFGTAPGKLNLVGSRGGALASGDITANLPFKFKFDGTQFRLVGAAPSETVAQVTKGAGRLLAVQTFSVTGVYVPTPGMQYCIAEAVGGGGAGAGAGGASGSGNVSLGAPGTSGTYGRAFFTKAQIADAQNVTIGAGGVPIQGGNGGNGGSTRLGGLLILPGGVGGLTLTQQVAPTLNGNGTTSAAATGANIMSQPGSVSSVTIALSQGTGTGGQGGNNPLGTGGYGSNVNGTGASGTGFGSGGSGCFVNGAGGSIFGGPGAPGGMIITEYGVTP